jgi:hypothetical protein
MASLSHHPDQHSKLILVKVLSSRAQSRRVQHGGLCSLHATVKCAWAARVVRTERGCFRLRKGKVPEIFVGKKHETFPESLLMSTGMHQSFRLLLLLLNMRCIWFVCFVVDRLL